MIVVDASAVLATLLPTHLGAQKARRLARSGERLHAPHLLDVEVAQGLRRFVHKGDITPERGRDALRDLAEALDATLLTAAARLAAAAGVRARVELL